MNAQNWLYEEEYGWAGWVYPRCNTRFAAGTMTIAAKPRNRVDDGVP